MKLFIILLISVSSMSAQDFFDFNIDDGDCMIFYQLENFVDTVGLMHLDSFEIAIIPPQFEEFEKTISPRDLNNNNMFSNKHYKNREEHISYEIKKVPLNDIYSNAVGLCKYVAPDYYIKIEDHELAQDSTIVVEKKLVQESSYSIGFSSRASKDNKILSSGYWFKRSLNGSSPNNFSYASVKKQLTKNIQESLNLRGYKIKVDGQFLKSTKKALNDFEYTNGFDLSEGTVNLETLKALRINFMLPTQHALDELYQKYNPFAPLK